MIPNYDIMLGFDFFFAHASFGSKALHFIVLNVTKKMSWKPQEHN
jgi:hypothetical protein